MALSAPTAAVEPGTDKAAADKHRVLTRYRDQVRRDPVGWCDRALGLSFWDQQAAVIEALRDKDRVTCRSANAAGKTFLAAAAAVWFLNWTVPGYVITTSSSWLAVKRQIWPTMHRILRRAPCREIGAAGDLQKLAWELGPQWGAFGVSPDSPENFSGFRTENGVLVIVDEASHVEQPIMDAILALCASKGSKVLMIGNPLRPSGPFFDSFRSGDWARFHISALDTPNVREGREVIPGLATREWVEERKREWGEDSPAYKARVLGEFPDESEKTLITLAWIEAARNREAVPGDEEIRVGVDVARFGDDLTVIQQVRGNVALPPEIIAKCDLMHVAGRVAATIRETGVKPEDVKIDANQMGWGVVDRLREQGIMVTPVNVGEKAFDSQRFANQRSEAAWELREWIREAGAIPDDPELMADLAAPEIGRYTSKGQMGLEPKEQTKKRLGGRSPDRFDALMLALYRPPATEQDVILDFVEV